MSASVVAAGSHRQTVSVVEGYRRWAPIYDASPNPMLALEERHVIPLLPNITGKRVLDLACGTGRWMRLLAAHQASSVVGVDVSDAMLRFAEPTMARHVVQADCGQLPLAPNRFDFAMCSFAASHVANLGSLAGECARVLKPHADLFLTDLHPNAHRAGWRTGFRDRDGAVEIPTVMRPGHQIVREFVGAGFNCMASEDLFFSEEERPTFLRAGKVDYFGQACRIPAVLFCHFRRLN